MVLAGCNKPQPAADLPEPEVQIPASQDASINLNFLGLEGQPNNTAEFMSRFDHDEFKLFPLRFPVNNMKLFTPQIAKTDQMRFAFYCAWGELRTERYGLQTTSGEQQSVLIPLREYQLEVTPRLLKADQGMYRVVIRDADGAALATIDLEGKADDAQLKPAKGYNVKQVYRDTKLRIAGYELRRSGASSLEYPLLGLQVIAEGWDGRRDGSARPPWSDYLRVFPEVDLRVLPHDWFHSKNIQDSSKRLKASAMQQAGKRYGANVTEQGTDFIRCYSCGN